MGECFLHGQGGSGSAKKIQGWVTQNISATFQKNTGSTPLLLETIEIPGEIATIRPLSGNRSQGYFYDYVNEYYLKYSTKASERITLSDEGVLIPVMGGYPDYDDGEYCLYVKKNGNNLDVYQTNTSSESVSTSVKVEVGYL